MTPASAAGPYARRLVVMVKEPAAGRIKTRLAREVGVTAATRFFRVNLAVTLLRLGRDARWQTILAVAPDAAQHSRMFPALLARMPQGGGDLGHRMSRAMRTLPPGPLVIIGADIPAITPSDIAAAFKALHGVDAVFGPAGDGGYWLVGLSARARSRPPFDNVRWSSPFALADTRANLKGIALAEVSVKDDVDTGDDFVRLALHTGRLIV